MSDNSKPSFSMQALTRSWAQVMQVHFSNGSEDLMLLFHGIVDFVNVATRGKEKPGKKFKNRPFDVLVASDAVGMGLNLTIRRIIFSTLEKYDGTRRRLLKSSVCGACHVDLCISALNNYFKLCQEVKQIAGRAGRYGTIYSEGIVTTLHEADKDYLQQCLMKTDSGIKGAGIFPSQSQLELLGALLDNNVDSVKTLEDFWKDHFDQSNESANLYVEFFREDMFRPEFVIQHFNSIEEFCIHLTRFMHMDRYPSWDDEKLQKRLRRRQRRRFPQTPMSTLFRAFKSSVTFPAPANPPDDILPRKPMKSVARKKKPSQSEGVKSLYFVGDLDEKIKAAEILEDVIVAGQTLTFRDQYIFCLAPVDVDNKEVVRAFSIIAERYLVASEPSREGNSDNIDEEIDNRKVRMPKKYLKFTR